VSSVEVTGLSIVAALVFIIVQHVALSRSERQCDKLHSLIVKIALGEVESKVDGQDIMFRKTQTGD